MLVQTFSYSNHRFLFSVCETNTFVSAAFNSDLRFIKGSIMNWFLRIKDVIIVTLGLFYMAGLLLQAAGLQPH